MSTENAPSEGALSLDQATAALMPAQPEEDTSSSQDAASPPEADATEADEIEQAQGETSAEGDASEAEEPGDGAEEAEQQEEPVAALEAPAYWSKDAKARFAELTPELQAVVLAQEGPREAAAAKAKAEAAEVVKTAAARDVQVQQLSEQLGTFLPEAIQTFQQRWGEPDWEATIQQYGSEQAALLRARYDREQSQLQRLVQMRNRAQGEAQQAYVQAEWAKLAEANPELAPDARDPTKGAPKRQEVTRYLLDIGIGRDAVAQISAAEMTLAHKAMLWDRAQAASKQKPVQQKQAARAPSSAARPSAALAGSPQQRSAQSVQNAFNAKPDLENAVALLMARGR